MSPTRRSLARQGGPRGPVTALLAAISVLVLVALPRFVAVVKEVLAA